MPRALRLLTAALLAVCLLAPSSLAQSGPEPGVTVDPNSPAGKEYALPVPDARSNAQGRNKKKSAKKSSKQSAPLFGQGVKPKRSTTTTAPAPPPATTSRAAAAPRSGSSTRSSAKTSSSKKSSSKKSSTTKRKSRHSHHKHRSATRTRKSAVSRSTSNRRSGPVAAPTDVAKIAAGANEPSSGGFGTTLVIIAGGLGVLLLGALAGLFLRRMRRE